VKLHVDNTAQICAVENQDNYRDPFFGREQVVIAPVYVLGVELVL
jgi:hypothetical protein